MRGSGRIKAYRLTACFLLVITSFLGAHSPHRPGGAEPFNRHVRKTVPIAPLKNDRLSEVLTQPN